VSGVCVSGWVIRGVMWPGLAVASPVLFRLVFCLACLQAINVFIVFLGVECCGLVVSPS
jgi:hypothetical protein